jgi:hypothetical protein
MKSCLLFCLTQKFPAEFDLLRFRRLGDMIQIQANRLQFIFAKRRNKWVYLVCSSCALPAWHRYQI